MPITAFDQLQFVVGDYEHSYTVSVNYHRMFFDEEIYVLLVKYMLIWCY